MCQQWIVFMKKDGDLELFDDFVTIYPGTKMSITRLGG